MPQRLQRRRTKGSAKRSEVEVRCDERGELDEIVAAHAHVHFERMSNQQFALIVETRTERACFLIGSVKDRPHVATIEAWRNSVNRRSESAKRRENEKKRLNAEARV